MLWICLTLQLDLSSLICNAAGTGKTLVARALAASASAAGRPVAFFMRKGADILSKWVGEAERQLRALFAEAQRCQPSIIFFDEIDGLAPVSHLQLISRPFAVPVHDMSMVLFSLSAIMTHVKYYNACCAMCKLSQCLVAAVAGLCAHHHTMSGKRSMYECIRACCRLHVPDRMLRAH